jgi:hypothetical protein
MPKGTVEIPVSVLSSVETLDELQDWLTAQNPQIVAELREAGRQDLLANSKCGNRAMSHGLPSRSRPEGQCSTERTGLNHWLGG